MTENSILNTLPARLKDARKAKGCRSTRSPSQRRVALDGEPDRAGGEQSDNCDAWNLTKALNVDFAGLLDGADTGDKIDVLKAAEVPTIDNMGDGCCIAICRRRKRRRA